MLTPKQVEDDFRRQGDEVVVIDIKRLKEEKGMFDPFVRFMIELSKDIGDCRIIVDAHYLEQHGLERLHFISVFPGKKGIKGQHWNKIIEDDIYKKE